MLNKFLVGIRPSNQMFRLTSHYGALIDAVLSCRTTDLPNEDYFTEVSSNPEKGAFRLTNPDLGNEVRVDPSNIIFSKDTYERDDGVETKTAIREFEAIYKVIDQILHIKDVRRIGIVAEHRFWPEGNPNQKFLSEFTKIDGVPYPAKFRFRYEARRQTKEGLAPDIAKSDFINVIYDYYDSELDTTHVATDALNANIDFQRYFSPLLSEKVWREVIKLQKQFDRENEIFLAKLVERGFQTGG